MGTLVKVAEQNNKHNDDGNEEARPDKPPSPPQGFSALEETNWALEEARRGVVAAAVDGRVRRVVAAVNLSPERVGRMQKTNAEPKAHQEPANVRKVIQSGQQSQHKGNDNVQNYEHQIFDRVSSLRPRIEQVQQGQSNNSKQRARSSGGGNARRGKITAHDKSEYTSTEVDEEESHRPNRHFHLLGQRHLQQHVEANVDKTSMQKDGQNEAEPLVRLRALVGIVESRVGHAAESTHFGKRAELIISGCVGAQEQDGDAGALNFLDVVHAGDVSCAHVDENLGRRADHGVELWLDHDRRASQDA